MTTNMIDDLRNRLAAAQTSTEAALDFAIGLYGEAAGYIKALEDFQQEAKLQIAEIFTETGITEAKTRSGQVYISKPSLRVNWDSKGLDALAANDDELAGLLAPFRKETQIAGALVVRTGGKTK